MTIPGFRGPAAAAALALAVLSPATQGGPGAHGPGGEHLDEPGGAGSARAMPRLEARTELFELVARLEPGMLSIFVDRYETNEPILEATVEAESGNLKEKAAYRREQGDFTVTGAAFLQAIGKPGSHPIVFTVTAGKDADLLEGSLKVAATPGSGSGGNLSKTALFSAIGGAAFALAAAGWALRRRGLRRRGLQGGLR